MSTAISRRYRSERAAVVGVVETIVARLPNAGDAEAAYLQRARALLLDAALALLDAEHQARSAAPVEAPRSAA